MASNVVDVTIIGGGPVGLFASFYAGLRGLSVRIIDSLPELGGQLTALYPEKYIYDMPGFPAVLAKDLAANLVAQAMPFEPELCLSETAEILEATEDGYRITTAKGTVLPTRKIMIAAGNGSFSPTKIGVEREDEFAEAGSLFYGVRDKSVFAGKRLAIVGGGDSAFDWALNLHDVAESITIVHRRDQFRAHEDTIRRVEQLGVGFELWKVVKTLHGGPQLSHISIEDTQTKEVSDLNVDCVVVNIGFKSSLGPLKDWGLNIEKNQIVVDRDFHTNLPGIYAVGDVCSFPGKLKLIATGVGEAASAVCQIKTELDPSAKLFPGHSSDLELSKP